MMMSREENKDVQAPDSSAIEAPCPLAEPGDGGGDNNNDGDVFVSASQEEAKMINSNIKKDGWEAARAWLMTLPRRRNVMHNEIEDWLHNNKHNLSREIITMPRQHLYRYLVNQHKLIRRADQPQSPQQQVKTCQVVVKEYVQPWRYLMLLQTSQLLFLDSFGDWNLWCRRRNQCGEEMEWLLSVSDYIVELIPAFQNFPDGSSLEVMVSRPRSDLQINLPALRKLDTMLLDALESFRDTEFWYVDQGILVPDTDGCGPLRRPPQRQEEKWWLPIPRVPPCGLSDNARKRLHHQRECTNQILKAAMAINSNVLSEMEVPEIYLEALPKNGKSSLGDIIYRYITAEQFSPDCLLDCLDLSSEHHTLEIANRIEAAIHVWRRKRFGKQSNSGKENRPNMKSSWGIVRDFMGDAEKRELLADRAESLLLSLKQRFPGLSQTVLDMSKIQYNMDVGQSILESYSRVLESLAFNIIARIDDLLYVDDLTKHSDPHQYSPIPPSVSCRGLAAKRVSSPFSVPPSNTPYTTAFTTPNFSPTPLISPGRAAQSPFVGSKGNPHNFAPIKVLSDYLGSETKSTNENNTKDSATLGMSASSKETGKYWSYTENLGSRRDSVSPPTRD